MIRPCSLTPVILSVAVCVGYAQQKTVEPTPLPELDGNSAKGLQIECRLAKKKFAIGEPVNIWCTVKNLTKSTAPLAWHATSGSHFHLAHREDWWLGGVLPLAIPQLDRPIMIKSQGQLLPGYILFIPPHESISILLTHKAAWPTKFKGKVVYDPLAPRGGAIDPKEGPPWKNECLSSNVIEYEVVAAGAK